MSKSNVAAGRAFDQPFPVYRNRRGALAWYQPIVEAWCVLTRRCSLHRSWQSGFDQGHRDEYRRIMINGGELGRVIDAAIYETGRDIANGAEPQYETLLRIRRATFRRLSIGPAALSRAGEVEHG